MAGERLGKAPVPSERFGPEPAPACAHRSLSCKTLTRHVMKHDQQPYCIITTTTSLSYPGTPKKVSCLKCSEEQSAGRQRHISARNHSSRSTLQINCKLHKRKGISRKNSFSFICCTRRGIGFSV